MLDIYLISKSVFVPSDQDVFDAKNDDDLVPMIIDGGGKENEGKQQGEPVTSRADGGAREVRKVGTSAGGEIPSKLVDGIMGSQLTIEVGTLLEIAPGVRQGLVAAARGRHGNPGPANQRRNPTAVAAVATKDDDDERRGTTFDQELITKTVNLTQARDSLMRVKVYVGDAVATAIIDTGSQLNLVSERKFCESGLVRTEEKVISFTGATGGGNTCIGTIAGVEVFISPNKLRTWAAAAAQKI